MQISISNAIGGGGGAQGGTPTPPPFSNVNSFSFDGIDDYFLVPDTSGLSFGDGSSDSPFSISAWIKMTDTSGFRILSKYVGSVAEYTFGTGGAGNLQLYLFNSTSNFIYRARIQGSVLNTGQWYHVVATYNGVGGTNAQNGIKIYVDGVRVDDTSGSAGAYVAMGNTISDAQIGKLNTSYTDGNIDEVSVFNSELSASDVLAIWNNGEPQSLDAYSPFVWFRLGDNATWNGATWTMTSVGTDTRIARSINMVEANRTTDVPTIFSNTKSIALDGVDDFVSTGLNLSYTTYPNVSFSCWIKMDKASLNTFTSYSPTGAYVQTYPNSSPIRIYTDASKNAYVRIQGNGTSNTTTDLADGNWHHILQTCRYEATGTVCNVYIDGVQEITNQLFLSYSQITGDFFVGATTATWQFFVGGIDEVAVFDSELSQSDVTSIYNGGVPNDISSLNPLSWWRCGDNDTAPTLTDNGSGGNDGTMTNFSTFSTDVPVELFSRKSIALDGVDDYVDCGNDSSLQMSGNFSISIWIKYSAAFTGYAFSGCGNKYGIYIQSNLINLQHRNLSNAFRSVSSTSAFNDGNWHHVLGVNDGTNLLLYIDGVLNNSNALGGASITSTLSARIGSISTATGWEFSGNIDEVAVWNSDQSSNASTIYNSGVPNDLSSLSPLSWWRCGDGDTSPILTDNGSGGNDGTMTNFSTFSTDVPT